MEYLKLVGELRAWRMPYFKRDEDVPEEEDEARLDAINALWDKLTREEGKEAHEEMRRAPWASSGHYESSPDYFGAGRPVGYVPDECFGKKKP